MINKLDFTDLPKEKFKVLREGATEPPFSGKFNLHKEKGMYVCGACGQELFSSEKKFDSGCGWPSFSDVVHNERIILKDDNSLGMKRIEVKCSNCNSHLGHVFDDGPTPTGKRYCINSLALDFKK